MWLRLRNVEEKRTFVLASSLRTPDLYLLLENPRSLSLWGPPDFLSTCLGIDSLTKLCLTLCSSMDWSVPGSPILHYLSEFAQTHVHWVVMPSNHLILCLPFSFCIQSFLALGSFPMSQLCMPGSQRIGLKVNKVLSTLSNHKPRT